MPSWIGPNGNWSDAANWSGGVPNGDGSVANFTFFNQTAPLDVTLSNAAVTTVGTLNINNAAVEVFFAGNTGPGGALTYLAFNNSLGANAAVNHNSSGLLTFSSQGGLRLLLNDTTVFNAASSGKIVVRAPVIGNGLLIKEGIGELQLLSTNSFTGGMQINGGRVYALGGSTLGTGQVTIANNANLHFAITGTVDNIIGTASGTSTTTGSARITAANFSTITLTGAISHLGAGTFTFGSAADTGLIVANLTGIGHNATQSSYAIAGGVLQFGNAGTAANLFAFNGTGTTSIASDAWLNTGGFTAQVTNLDLNGGTIYTTSGALRLTINDRTGSTANQVGQIRGTGNQDVVTVRVLGNGTTGNYDLSTLTFANWTAGLDVVNLIGTSLGNALGGSQVDDYIAGGGGIDFIQAGAGNDEVALIDTNGGSWVDGGSGTDRLTISNGAISLGSIAGIEELNFANGGLIMSVAQFLSSLPSTVLLDGTGALTINKASSDASANLGGLNFAAGADVTININGSTATDIIKGAIRGSNTINGGDSNDQIRGGNLGDTINGGTGNDKIYGAGGADVLTGGTGTDQFRYVLVSDSGLGAAADRIADFEIAGDRFNFSAMDANAVSAGDQAFDFIGNGAFANTGTGQIRYQDSGANLLLQIDADGNGVIDMEVVLQGLAGQTLTAANFIL